LTKQILFKTIVIATGLLLQFSLWAQIPPVTLHVEKTDTLPEQRGYEEVILPTSIVAVSALFVNNGWLTQRREDVQDIFSAHGKNHIKIDDYMQYSPMLAVYALNLCGIKGKHSFVDRTIILAMSYAIMGMVVNSMKYSFKEKRPDSNTKNSFPSGHTATAFMGAEFLYQEYKETYSLIGYGIAAITGYLRIYNDRHWINDVVAGACIGLLSTKLSYWLYPKIFKKRGKKTSLNIIGLPNYSQERLGMNVCIVF